MVDKQTSDIFAGLYTGEEVQEKPPEGVVPETEEVQEEPVQTEPVQAEPVQAEEPEEPVEAQSEEPTETNWRLAYEQLAEQIGQGGGLHAGTAGPTEQPQPDYRQDTAPLRHPSFDPQEVLDSDKIRRLVDEYDPAPLVEAFQAAYQAGLEAATARAAATVGPLIDTRFMVQNELSDFFTANPDLASFRPNLGVAVNQIAAANPRLSLKQLLDGAGKEVRKKLNLPEPGKPSKQSPPTAATRATSKVTKKSPPPKPDAIKAEMEDMFGRFPTPD